MEGVNRTALKIAREIATETGTLMAGGICSTKTHVSGDKEVEARIRDMYTEQVLV